MMIAAVYTIMAISNLEGKIGDQCHGNSLNRLCNTNIGTKYFMERHEMKVQDCGVGLEWDFH